MRPENWFRLYYEIEDGPSVENQVLSILSRRKRWISEHRSSTRVVLRFKLTTMTSRCTNASTDSYLLFLGRKLCVVPNHFLSRVNAVQKLLFLSVNLFADLVEVWISMRGKQVLRYKSQLSWRLILNLFSLIILCNKTGLKGCFLFVLVPSLLSVRRTRENFRCFCSRNGRIYSYIVTLSKILNFMRTLPSCQRLR